MAEDGRTGETKTFVLRLWSEESGEGPRVRMTLEDPRTRARRSFSSFGDLARFAGSLFGRAARARREDAPPSRRRAALAAVAALLPSLTAAAEPPSLALGPSAGRPGSTVTVPVLLRAADLEPVGALSLRVLVEPPSAAESITFRKAGAWSARRTAFEARPQGGGSWSWIVSVAEPSPAASTTQVGEVVVRLSRDVAAGTDVVLRLDPGVSGFGDRAGTRFVSVASGGLLLSDGIVTVDERPAGETNR